jgi:tetratricopeptide (TPR) repeat protein
MLGKARCLRRLGRVDMAVTSYMQAAGLAGNLGDIDSQIEALSGVIEGRPKTLTAYYTRGDLFFERGNYDRAAGDYEQVIQLDRRNLGAYYKLGRSYYNGERYKEALGAFHGAEDLNFADPRAQVYLAETYLALNDEKNTKKSFEKFEEMASYSVRLQFKDDPDWQRVLEAVGAEH